MRSTPRGGDAERQPEAAPGESVRRWPRFAARARGQGPARGRARDVGAPARGVRRGGPSRWKKKRQNRSSRHAVFARRRSRDGEVRGHGRAQDARRRAVLGDWPVHVLRRGRAQAEGAPRRAEPVLLREVVRRLQKAGRDDAARHRGVARVARQRARGGPRVRRRRLERGHGVEAGPARVRVLGGEPAHEARADADAAPREGRGGGPDHARGRGARREVRGGGEGAGRRGARGAEGD